MIKRLLIVVMFIYPCVELSRLILVFPAWEFMDLRPIVELCLIWGCFIFGIYISNKDVRWRSK